MTGEPAILHSFDQHYARLFAWFEGAQHAVELEGPGSVGSRPL